MSAELSTQVHFAPEFLRRLGLRIEKLRAQGLLRYTSQPSDLSPASGGKLRGLTAGYELDRIRVWRSGDDPRQVDWAATLRSGETMVRVVRGESAPECTLVLDASLSMAVGQPTKLQRAAELAAWLAAYLLELGGRVHVVVHGASVQVHTASSRAQLSGLLVAFQGIRPAGRWSAAELANSIPQRGHVWVIGDYMSIDPWASNGALCTRRTRGGLRALLVLAPEERDPQQGAVLWRDPEDRRASVAHIDSALQAKYNAELSSELDKRASALRQMRGQLVVVTSDGAWDEQCVLLDGAL